MSDRISRTSTELESFNVLGHYRLLSCLGEGGMGQVWAARDISSPRGRIVAIKTTKQQGVEAAKVLWDEARIASLIEHPNVCRVRELGKEGETQYLVLDWCDGASLYDLLQNEPEGLVPLHIAAKIIAFVAAGLHAAHELTGDDDQPLGVVHRDVSPQNVLISTHGVITVTDFGVAKALGQAHKATETGEVKGKLSYMAPEQVKSKDVDRRSDVFALGCVLYLATLGKRPFSGGDALTTLYQILEQDIDRPRSVRPDYPEELERIVMKALEKDPDKRHQTAEELQRELEQWLVDSEVRIGEPEIAALLMSRLGDSIQERNERLRAQSKRAGELGNGRASGTGTAPSKQHSEATGDTDLVHSTTAQNEPVASSGRPRWLLPVAVVLGTALLGFAALQLSTSTGPTDGDGAPVDGPVAATQGTSPAEPNDGDGRQGDTQVAPPPTTSLRDPEATSQTKQEKTVTVRVSVQPNTANIFLDGRLVGTGKYQSTAPRSTEGHVLRIVQEGYQEATRALVFDRTKDIEVQLSPEARAPKPTGRVQRPAPTPTPEPARKPKKEPRALDSDNPFANP